MEALKIVIISVIISAIFGALAAFILLNQQSENDLIKGFYLTENAVHVSPHAIRNAMDKGDSTFILVDLRSQEEYEKEHIAGAVSIPAYKDPDTSDYSAVDRIANSFKELKNDNPNKDIIVYCYSMPCMTGRKIGKMLTEHGIFVKHLEIGWNEWRYFWGLWNYEHEWNATNVTDYIASGSAPGAPKLKVNPTACPIKGEFGC